MTVTMATVRADPHHMVMMANLRRANIAFIANDLFAVFAQLTVHVVIAGINLGQPFGKTCQHHRMIFEVPSLDELYIAKLGGNFVGVGVNPVDQNARKQEIGENDNAFIAQFHRFAQTGIYPRMGDTGIADFGAAKTKTFLQHPGDFIDVRIGIRVVRAPPDNHQKRVFARDAVIDGGKRFFDAVFGCTQQFGINRQIAAKFYVDIGVFIGEIIDLARQVIFDVTSGKQHARKRINFLMAHGFELFKAIAQDRVRKFEKAAFDIVVGQMGLFHRFNHGVEL